jgi:hypothetical protein
MARRATLLTASLTKHENCSSNRRGAAGARGRRRGPRWAASRYRASAVRGGDWYANPSSLPNLIDAINQRTSLKVEKTEGRVTLLDDRLWDFAFLHVTGHGDLKFTDAEVDRLRQYLLRGGFLHVSDNYGLDPNFRREIARRVP